MGRLKALFRRAREIYRNEGFLPLIRRGFGLAFSRLFFYRTYYLYEHSAENIARLNEADFIPKIAGLTFKVVCSNQEADDLEADGFEFRSHPPSVDSRKALDAGAIALCMFLGRKLTNIGWLAATQNAKDALNEPPYKVDFSNNEVCSTAVWTNPEHRGMGLNKYGHYKRSQFKSAKGLGATRSVIAKSNISMQKSYAGPVPTIYAEGRYLRILWWKSWKERPLSQ